MQSVTQPALSSRKRLPSSAPVNSMLRSTVFFSVALIRLSWDDERTRRIKVSSSLPWVSRASFSLLSLVNSSIRLSRSICRHAILKKNMRSRPPPDRLGAMGALPLEPSRNARIADLRGASRGHCQPPPRHQGQESSPLFRSGHGRWCFRPNGLCTVARRLSLRKHRKESRDEIRKRSRGRSEIPRPTVNQRRVSTVMAAGPPRPPFHPFDFWGQPR